LRNVNRHDTAGNPSLGVNKTHTHLFLYQYYSVEVIPRVHIQDITPDGFPIEQTYTRQVD